MVLLENRYKPDAGGGISLKKSYLLMRMIIPVIVVWYATF